MKEGFARDLIVAIASAAIGAAITGAVTIYTNAKTEDQIREDTKKYIVETLSNKFDFVDAQMSFDTAIGELKSNNDKLEKNIDSLEEDNKELAATIQELKKRPFVEAFQTVDILRENISVKSGVPDAVAIIGNQTYFSLDAIKYALEENFAYYQEDGVNIFSYATTGSPANKETKISLEESNTLYDGSRCTYYKSSESGTFSLGSNIYKSGFTLKTGYTGRSDGDYSNALFDLQGKYSKISFDVGKVTGEENLNAIMSIYIDGKHSQDYDLSANVVSKHFDIDLNYANDLMIQININDYNGTKYGFANVFFEY